MFSKSINLIFFVLGLLFISSCGIKFGEKNNQDEAVKIKSADCLSQSLPSFKRYFQGKASDVEAQASFQCLQDVFVSFRENIRGQSKDSYTPQEIALFVQQNFFSNNEQFSSQFLDELMHFKMALFGGDTQVIKKTEVDSLVEFLKRLTPELVHLNKHMPIITFNWKQNLILTSISQTDKESEKEKKFLEAKFALNQFTLKFAAEFERLNNSYTIDHLANLIKETALFIKSDQEIIKKIEVAKPFIKKFKLLLIGGDAHLKGKDWSRLFLTLHEFLFQTLRYEYFLKELTGDNLEVRWLNYQKISLDVTKLLESLVQNKDSRSLSNDEISQLLSELQPIFEEAKFDKSLLDRIAELKVSLLGQSQLGSNGWSVSDLQRLQVKIPIIFSSLSKLHRLYKTLDEKGFENSNLDKDEFLSLEKKFLSEIGILGQQFNQPYSLSSLKQLVAGLANGPFNKTIKLPKNYDQVFDLASSAKETMTGNKGSVLNVNDLRMMLDLGAGFYFHYLQYKLFVKPFEFVNTNFVGALSEVWYKAVNTVDSLLIRRQSKTIKTREIIPLIIKLQETDFLDTNFKSQSLETVFDALWSNLLNDPQVRLSGYSQQGLNKVTLSRLKTETEIFFKTQNQIAVLYRQSKIWNRKSLINQLVTKLSQTSDRNEQIGLSEIIYLNGKSVPLNFDDQTKFLKILTNDSESYSYYDITVSNISRALSRLIITSYANDIERVRKKIGLTLNELVVAFNQFKSIAADSGALDPENTTFINNRFLEANLFLSVSNGDQFAQFDEIHNLLLHINSGLNRADVFKGHIKKQCGFSINNRRSFSQKVDYNCLLNSLYSEQQAFLGLPGFLNLRGQFSNEEVMEYLSNLLFAAGYEGGGEQVKVSDMDLIPHVIQYVEMVFVTYDQNQNGFLEKEEALKAFPVFQKLIKELTASYNLKDEELPGVFIYLLKNGRGPKTIPEKLKFLDFIRNPSKWNIQTSRLGVGKIFRFIADAKKEKSGSSPTPESPTAKAKKKAEEEKRKQKEMEDLYKG